MGVVGGQLGPQHDLAFLSESVEVIISRLIPVPQSVPNKYLLAFQNENIVA